MSIGCGLVGHLKLAKNLLCFYFISFSFLLFQDETEWQQYLRHSVETVMKVAEILPQDVLRIMVIY